MKKLKKMYYEGKADIRYLNQSQLRMQNTSTSSRVVNNIYNYQYTLVNHKGVITLE